LEVKRLSCRACNLSYEGNFAQPRLARLSAANMELAELFLLSGGNMKVMAEALATSYPTLRKRVDDLIGELEELRREDDRGADLLLSAVEKGEMTAEEAARIGRERNGSE